MVPKTKKVLVIMALAIFAGVCGGQTEIGKKTISLVKICCGMPGPVCPGSPGCPVN